MHKALGSIPIAKSKETKTKTKGMAITRERKSMGSYCLVDIKFQFYFAYFSGRVLA
jgi:hypothetical protein